MINLLTLLLYTSEDCSTYAVKVTLIFFRICYKNRQQCLFYYSPSEKKVENPNKWKSDNWNTLTIEVLLKM